MHDRLSAEELVALVSRVFQPTPADERLAILVDLPDDKAPDTTAWRERRELAASWYELLAPRAAQLGLSEIRLALYRNPRANNADLPATCVFYRGGPLPDTADDLAGDAVPFDTVFENFRILVAPTQFSATAPLKVAARQYGFRAATMPGFSKAMIPALRIDYGIVGARTARFKNLLDRATRCEIAFDAAGRRCDLVLDLRHREATASGGVFPAPGVAGNLPSGETYIVPYEGEILGDPTASAGEIPVQFGADIVVYRVENNRAVEVLGDSPAAEVEREKLLAEPAYGNLAELGLGVLADFGLQPTGEILLDEKLGLHIAFGRSEHFGGQVGPGDFSSPEAVVHIDRVYIPELQPDVRVALAVLTMEDGAALELMRDGSWVVGFD